MQMSDVTIGMQELLSRLPRTDTPEFRSSYESYGEREALLTIQPANILLALLRAREAQALAVSWRDFKVGAAAVAISTGSPRFEIMTGVNVKPDEDSQMNVHAEQSALQKVRDRRYDRVSIVAVVGETQSDSQSGHTMHTLHPCGLCRSALGESKSVNAESTLIVSALPDMRTIEAYSLNQLKQYHQDPDSIELTRFSLPDMEILKPIDWKNHSDSAMVINNTPEIQAEEDIWFNSVGFFAVNWMNYHLARLEAK